MIKVMEITNDVPVLQTVGSFGSDVMTCDFGAKFHLATGSGDKTVRVLQWHVGSGYVDALYSPITPHKYAVTSVRFSPQGTMLATASIDGTAALWNVATGVRIATFVQPTGSAVRVCRFSPDSTLLATADDDSAIALWDLVMRNLIRTFQHHEGSVQAISFTPDSSYLLTTCTQGVMKLWEVLAQEEAGTWLASVDDAHDLGVMGSDFSSAQEASVVEKDVYLLATCGNDNLVKLWLTSVGRRSKHQAGAPSEIAPRATLTGHSSAVSCVRFSPSGTYLASTSIDKTTRIWEMGGGCLAVLEGHSRYVVCCAFARDGTLLATGSNDKTLIVWDLTRTKTLASALVPPSSATSQMALAECANKGESEAAVVKHAEVGGNEVRLLQRIQGHDGAVNSCHFHGNNLLATGCGDKAVRLFGCDNEQRRFAELPVSPLEGHRYSVNKVEFSPDGGLLASCSLDGTTIAWDVTTGRRGRPSFQCNAGGVRTCRFSPDGHLLVTAGDDNAATVFNSSSMAALTCLTGHSDAVVAVAFSPDSQYLATCGSEGNVKLWSVAPCADRCLLTIDEAHDLGAQSCDFSPGDVIVGTERRYLLATCGNDSLVKLWTVATPRYHGGATFGAALKRSLAGHGGNVMCVRFAGPAGDVLASTATDHTARLWNVYTGECVHVLENHDSMVICCAFSQDSSLFATGSLDKTVLVWELPQQLVFQTVAAVRLRGHRKRLLDWSVADVEKWLTKLGLAELTDKARLADLTGEQLVALASSDVLDLLDIPDEEARRGVALQLYWLRREDAGALEVALDMEPPDEFLCPITHEVMREPVTCADGFTYERAAINEWFLSGKFSSPMTNAGLSDTRCEPNAELRARICSFLYGEGE